MTDQTERTLRAILEGFEQASEAFDKIASGLRALAPTPRAKGTAEYRSPLQTAILEAIQLVDHSNDAIKLSEFVDIVVGLLPVPDGDRDTRRLRVKRAIEGFNKKAESPLALKGDLVVFYV